jgi:glycosyltransferase involved in cell wall biosynthesis
MHVIVVTYLVSPYQVELFNAIHASARFDLEIIYLHRRDPTRSWATPLLKHKALCLDEEPCRFKATQSRVLQSDLVIFNYYAEYSVHNLLNARVSSGKPWCFWGERPGFRTPAFLGRVRRMWQLARLHASQVPIWGIGRFAVEGYKAEFGYHRPYYNVPYFSDLERFRITEQKQKRSASERIFLFSGSLIRRKGVDLLGRAFLRLAREHPHVQLKFLGEGKLHGYLAHLLMPVRDQVEFLGFKDWPELPIYYAAADVLCVPSRYDGWGLVVPEGLASGLPVIGSDRTGAAIEFIQPDQNGWLIPSGDENALFARMRAAALLPDTKMAQLSRSAHESVSTHSLQHGVRRFIRACEETYDNCRGLIGYP